MTDRERKERLRWVLKAMHKLDDEFSVVTTCDAIAESGLDGVCLHSREVLLFTIEKVRDEIT